MKNWPICTLLACILSGCSFFDFPPGTVGKKTTSRSIASVQSQSCADLASYLIGRRNLYSRPQFENELTNLGFGYVYHSMKLRARQEASSRPHQTMLLKMRQHLKNGADVDQFLNELNEQERRLLWRDIVRPETFKIEEQLLSNKAVEGDEIASFLLEVPRGAQRDNAESAIILMKQLDPEIDDASVVARLQKELGGCLTR